MAVMKVKTLTTLFKKRHQNVMFLIVLAEAIEDPSMITQPKEIKKPAVATPKTFDAAALGATIKQNIVEKLPVINNQVRSVHSMGKY